MGDPCRACSRAPRCAADYQAKISGPLLDRIDLHVDVEPVLASDPVRPSQAENSQTVRTRIIAARARQQARREQTGARTNAELSTEM